METTKYLDLLNIDLGCPVILDNTPDFQTVLLKGLDHARLNKSDVLIKSLHTEPTDEVVNALIRAANAGANVEIYGDNNSLEPLDFFPARTRLAEGGMAIYSTYFRGGNKDIYRKFPSQSAKFFNRDHVKIYRISDYGVMIGGINLNRAFLNSRDYIAFYPDSHPLMRYTGSNEFLQILDNSINSYVKNIDDQTTLVYENGRIGWSPICNRAVERIDKAKKETRF